MKKVFTFLAAAVVALSLNAEVLWQADFSKDGDENLGGFVVKKTAPNDSAKIEGDALVLNFNKGINKGMVLAQEIPFPEKGELSFDAIMNVGSKPGYGAWSVNMNLFGLFFAWNGSNNMGLCKYEPPTTWTTVIKGEWNKKINYRIRFDRVNKTVDFFINNSMVPAKTFTDVKFKEPVDGKGTYTIGNYGYASGNLIHKISNMKLETYQDIASISEPVVLWTEKFEKNGTLLDNGYKNVRDNKKDQFMVQDGVLTAICQNSPYKGSSFTKMIPGAIRGELSFEASATGGSGYNHLAFTVNIGTIMVSFNRGTQFHLFKPKGNSWRVITAKLSRGDWHKFLIRFDSVSHVAEYYVDDMENPAYIDEECHFEPMREMLFRLSNYGLCSGTVTGKIRNIEWKAIPEKKKVIQ